MKIAFTDRELDVMAVLWAGGSATVAEVRQRLADKWPALQCSLCSARSKRRVTSGTPATGEPTATAPW
jgi:hypothetical protein